MPDDFLRIDSPAAQQELEQLRTTQVGDVRKSDLFPAIPTLLQWTCTKIGADWWQFEARFCGEVLMAVTITAELPNRLVLNIEKMS